MWQKEEPGEVTIQVLRPILCKVSSWNRLILNQLIYTFKKEFIISIFLFLATKSSPFIDICTRIMESCNCPRDQLELVAPGIGQLIKKGIGINARGMAVYLAGRLALKWRKGVLMSFINGNTSWRFSSKNLYILNP